MLYPSLDQQVHSWLARNAPPQELRRLVEEQVCAGATSCLPPHEIERTLRRLYTFRSDPPLLVESLKELLADCR